MPTDALERGKTDARRYDGTWLGFTPSSDEYLIGTPAGIFKARTLNRKPLDMRWGSAQLKNIKGTPWHPTPGLRDDSIRSGPPPSSPQPTAAPDRREHDNTA